jgi:heptaprenyl diphosphate synthase/octaprenyl-diphosphate synthase
MTETIENLVQFIYAPVKDDLDRVAEDLQALTAQAGLPGDGLLTQAIGGGGKMVRPAVTLLAASFHDHDHKMTIRMGLAVELLHLATLIHDDSVDNSAMRRGRATIDSMFGRNVAVLLGDYVFATSATFVCDTGNVRVIRRFSETIMELASGELMEHFSAYNWQQSRDDYEKRIYNKTASLFCTAAESGAVLSGTPEATSQALNNYGYNLGMSFQIMDDVLDFQGTEEELGKPVGNDLLQGTVTLPVLLFMDRFPHEPVFRRLMDGSRDEGDLRQVIAMVRDSTILDDAMQVAAEYRTSALAALSGLENNRARQSLEALTNYVTHRRS